MDKIFITKGQTNWQEDLMNPTEGFRNFLPPLQICWTPTEGLEITGLLISMAANITLLSVRSKQLYRLHFCWHKCLKLGKLRFQMPLWISLRQRLVTFLITSLPLHSWHFQFITTTLINMNCVSWSSLRTWDNLLPKKNCVRYYHKCTQAFLKSDVLLVWLYWKNIVLHKRSKSTEKSNFLKFRPLGIERREERRDWRRDISREAYILFRNFAKALKILNVL